MRVAFTLSAGCHAQACRVLEALCEGYVLAMLDEFNAHPEGEFPCCIKCADFQTADDPLAPAETRSVVECAAAGEHVGGLGRCSTEVSGETFWQNPGRRRPSAATTPGRPAPTGTLRVRSARELIRNGGGHSVELACYQCAMKRYEGADLEAKVVILCTVPGTFRGAVLMSGAHIKEEKRGQIDDPVVHARPATACECLGAE